GAAGQRHAGTPFADAGALGPARPRAQGRARHRRADVGRLRQGSGGDPCQPRGRLRRRAGAAAGRRRGPARRGRGHARRGGRGPRRPRNAPAGPDAQPLRHRPRTFRELPPRRRPGNRRRIRALLTARLAPTASAGAFRHTDRTNPEEISMTAADKRRRAAGISALAPAVPGPVTGRVADAAPLARALVAGGLPAPEVTLRTPAALDAIRAMAEVPGGVVGAGTLLTPAD